MELMGPDGQKYVIPPHQLDDWKAWVLLHEGEDMPKWTAPLYAKILMEVRDGLSNSKSE